MHVKHFFNLKSIFFCFFNTSLMPRALSPIRKVGYIMTRALSPIRKVGFIMARALSPIIKLVL